MTLSKSELDTNRTSYQHVSEDEDEGDCSPIASKLDTQKLYGSIEIGSEEQTSTAGGGDDELTYERNHGRSLSVIIACTFLSDMTRGIIFPTLWMLIRSLNGSKVTQGYAVSAFSFGRILSSPLFGRLSELHGYRPVLVLCNLVISLGCFIYTLGISFDNLYIIVMAQFIVGFGAGSLGVTRSYVAETTTKAERTSSMAYLCAFQYGGFAVTPILGAGISYLCTKKVDSNNLNYVNQFSAPALFMMLASLSCIFLLYSYFDDIERATVSSSVIPIVTTAEEHREVVNSIEDGSGSNKMHESLVSTTNSEEGKVEDEDEGADQKCCGLKVALIDQITMGCCLMNVACRGSIGVFETLVVSYAFSHFQWSSMETGLAISCCGFIGVVILLNFSCLMQFTQDTKVVVYGFILMVASCCLLTGLGPTPTPEGAFLLSLVLMYAVGYPLGQTSVLGVFSKVLRGGPQGKLFGFFGSSGSLARIIFPLVAGLFTEHWGEGSIFSLITALLLVALVCYCFSINAITRVMSIE